MLYVTTRNEYDAYTVHRAVHEAVGADGGGFLPFRMPVLSPEEIASLQERSFGQCVADTLNLFFSCGLNGWDVDLRVGRHAAKLVTVPHRVTVAELWHNIESDYARFEKVLNAHICGDDAKPNSWVRIAIRIAVLTGLYGMMLRAGHITVAQKFDVAVPTGDFTMPMAAWYLRQMGFPVANIICCCNDNSSAWELLQQGEVKTDVAVKRTSTPLADDGIPGQLERLICGTLGTKEVERFYSICELGGTYAPPVGMLETLRSGMTASVVSSHRLGMAIPNVYNTAGYIMGPYLALSYGGLVDYRAKTGLRRPALLLADRSPVCDKGLVCTAMGWTEAELREKLI